MQEKPQSLKISPHLTRIPICHQKSLIAFQNSQYQLHILDPECPIPHYKLTLQQPISSFHHLSLLPSAIKTQAGKQNICYIFIFFQDQYACYRIEKQGSGIKVEESGNAFVMGKIVGVWGFPDGMVGFVGQDGQLEYNYVGRDRMFHANKLYDFDNGNDKLTKSNLQSPYTGRQLLQSSPEQKLTESLFSASTNTLITVRKSPLSNLFSLQKYFLQDYCIITGQDFLLNLPGQLLQIELFQNIIIINLGDQLVLWSSGKKGTQTIAIEGWCTWMDVRVDGVVLCGQGRAKGQEERIGVIWKCGIKLLSKEDKEIAKIDIGVIKEIREDFVGCYYMIEKQKTVPAIGVNNKLQLIYWDKSQNSKPKVIISNIQSKILQATFFQQPDSYANYLKIVKKIGYSYEQKIVTNNRIISAVQQYQHNMLIKMANVIKYGVNGEEAQIYISSPIIGTYKFSLKFAIEKDKKSSKFILQKSPTQPPLTLQQQTLFLSISPFQQLTPTKILTKTQKNSISDLFQNSIDSILSGIFLGSYILLLVQKQVHIFSISPPSSSAPKSQSPKRLHLCCFDNQIRKLIPINEINVWGVLFWNGLLEIWRIQEKESIKMAQIDNVGLVAECHLGFNCVVNTVPYVGNIIGNWLVLCTNDPLHVYQVDKIGVKLMEMNKQVFGEGYFPVVDFSANRSQDKFTVLSHYNSRWTLITFQTKYLVKNLEQIKIEVEQILAFPINKVQNQGLLACFIKDGNVFLLCGSKIYICEMKSGAITYNIYSVLGGQKIKTNIGLPYIKKFLSQNQITYKKYPVQSHQNMSQTHPNILKLSPTRAILSNQKQLWYSSILSSPPTLKPLSYFSISNDSFVEFRNNLTPSQLQNVPFMQLFADKLPIISIYKISQQFVAILYTKMIVIVEISPNGALAIYQEILFKQYEKEGLMGISKFVGRYDQRSLFMKDSAHRLVLLKYQESQGDIAKGSKYVLEILEELEDEIVCYHMVKGWKERIRKFTIDGKEEIGYQKFILKQDGQLLIGKQIKPTYL